MTYYDHERAWERIARGGGRGWDDLTPGGQQDSYVAIDAFLSEQPLVPGALALDLGCGGGQVSLLLAERGLRVTGIDFSPSAIELARENARRAGAVIDFRVADVLTPFDGAFELVIDCHVLHCLLGADRGTLLRNVFRALTPGGLFFSDTMCAEGHFDPAIASADPATRVSLHGNRYWVRESELRDELLRAGFAIEALARRASDPGFGDMIETRARKPGSKPPK